MEVRFLGVYPLFTCDIGRCQFSTCEWLVKYLVVVTQYLPCRGTDERSPKYALRCASLPKTRCSRGHAEETAGSRVFSTSDGTGFVRGKIVCPSHTRKDDEIKRFHRLGIINRGITNDIQALRRTPMASYSGI